MVSVGARLQPGIRLACMGAHAEGAQGGDGKNREFHEFVDG
jgi:hypothetical protein